MGQVFSSGLSLSGGWSFTPFLAILAVVVVVVLLLVAAGVAFGRRRVAGGGPVAYFLYGLSLVSLGIVVISAGVTVHAVRTRGTHPAGLGRVELPLSGQPASRPRQRFVERYQFTCGHCPLQQGLIGLYQPGVLW